VAAHLLYTLRLTAAETIAALYRKVRTGEIDARQAQQAEAAFRADWAWQYEIGEATEAVVERAMTLARRHPLRGYDALHLAAALTLNRPERLTAASGPMLRSFSRALVDADRDPDVRAIIITGAGRGFCAGLDLKDFAAGTGIGNGAGNTRFDLRESPPMVLHT